eukprot:SAG22_NODE_882_length_6687_cov_5.782332_5_plen_167_part_00
MAMSQDDSTDKRTPLSPLGPQPNASPPGDRRGTWTGRAAAGAEGRAEKSRRLDPEPAQARSSSSGCAAATTSASAGAAAAEAPVDVDATAATPATEQEAAAAQAAAEPPPPLCAALAWRDPDMDKHGACGAIAPRCYQHLDGPGHSDECLRSRTSGRWPRCSRGAA